MVVGYASLVMFFIKKELLTGLLNLFSDIGKMALSNYLLQSIICSLFFYGYGMGYYGRIGQFGLYFLVVEIFIVQVVFTAFWLRYYQMGPAEWLLKSLVHKKKVPFRRKEQSGEPATSIQTTI
jgi:uncharacterized protein